MAKVGRKNEEGGSMATRRKLISSTPSSDITEPRRAGRVLPKSKEWYRDLLENANDLIQSVAPDGRFIYVNKTWRKVLGYSAAEVANLRLWDIIHPESIPHCRQVFQKVMSGETVRNVEAVFVAKNGKLIPVEGNANCQFKEGKPVSTRGIFRDITERKQAEQRIEHLNAVLRAIRNVNQLIAREKDRGQLLKGVCDSLVETRGYYNAWLAIFDESGGLMTAVEAGLGNKFLSMVELLRSGRLTDCAQRVLTQSEVVVTETPFSTCIDCPLSGMYRGRGAMTVRLEYGEEVYGVLSVSIPRALVTDKEEQSLVKEVASDAAFALHDIELEEERRRVEQELREVNEQLRVQQQILTEKSHELEVASQAKSEFLAGMSHELRTPLNAIIGFSELMLDGIPGGINDEQRQCLSDILSSGQHLLNLINDVLDLSKVEARKLELRVENLNLADVIDDMMQAVKPMLDENRHKLRVNVEEGLPQVHADKSRLRQIFLNLLSNAVKFTPAGGELGIEVSRKGDWCQVSVIDNGIGIKQEDQERIFEAFTQIDTLPDREKEGAGLGLTVTKQLVELGGGRIWVESKYGKGSKFTFTLPLA